MLVRQFKQLSDYVWYYLAAKSDSAKLQVRNALLRLAFALMAFAILAGLSVMGAWFVVSGVAEGLGAALGERPWLGRILTGFLLGTTLWVGTRLAVSRFTKAALDATVAKIERQKNRQQDRHVPSAAARPTPDPEQN